ncbi:MAG: MlaD family protein [Solirubrobacteraceae bacterium]
MTLRRTLVLSALAVVLIALLYAFYAATSGGDAEYKLLFTNVNNLVLGDQVQVGGVPVGTVKAIALHGSNYRAQVTIGVEDSIAPLHQGTMAQVRVPSLSSVANRYIALKPGPNNYPVLREGATIPARNTETAVNIDELFNIFTPRTRRGVQQLVEGFATQYKGVGQQLQLDSRYFGPALGETSRLLSEFVRNEKTLAALLVEGAKAVGTLGAHRQQVSGLVRNGGKAFAALGSQERSLEAGLKQLPEAFASGRHAFAKLPSALASLERLIDVSKPNTTTLAHFFKRLETLLRLATPVVSQLHLAFRRPGPANDLTEFALDLPGLARSLERSSPAGVKALRQSVSRTAPFGPYAPDLQGLFRNFGASAGYYDANGHFLRGSPVFPDFKQSGEKLIPLTAAEAREAKVALEGLTTGQTRRCPGAATQPAPDGSSPFSDAGKLGCQPAQVTP